MAKQPWGEEQRCARCLTLAVHLWAVDGNNALCGSCADIVDECPHTNVTDGICDYCQANLSDDPGHTEANGEPES